MANSVATAIRRAFFIVISSPVFAGQLPSHELAAAVRRLSDELEAHAPAYLHPHPQRKLLATATDCLEVVERAVNWEAEKLYGVEGHGPFDEF